MSLLSTAQTLSVASQFNNEGVREALYGSPKTALMRFQSALTALRSLAQLRDTKTSPELSPINVPFQVFPIDVATNSATPTTLKQEAFIYSKLLLLDCDVSRVSFESSLLSLYCAAVTFNMGIIHHVLSKAVVVSSNSTHADRALKMYKISLSIFDGALSALLDASAVVAMIILAYNNCAEIYYSRGDYRRCQCCLRTVEDFSRACLDAVHIVSEEDMSEIMLNVMFLQTPVTASAA